MANDSFPLPATGGTLSQTHLSTLETLVSRMGNLELEVTRHKEELDRLKAGRTLYATKVGAVGGASACAVCGGVVGCTVAANAASGAETGACAGVWAGPGGMALGGAIGFGVGLATGIVIGGATGYVLADRLAQADPESALPV